MHILELERIDYDNEYTNGTSNGSMDSVFRQIPKNSTAFFIWRIENSSLVPVQKEQYGSFYDTDCYIIYAASFSGKPAGPDLICRDAKQQSLDIHVHFWLGAETTSDKSGIAAYKSMELDSFLQKKPTQHREVQCYESPRFKSYFKNGIKIFKGVLQRPVNSSDFVPQLFKISGKATPIILQLSKLSWEYFNSGEIFICLTETVLFIWIGRGTNGAEKLRATKVAVEMQKEHTIPSICFVDDGYEQTLPENEKDIFQKYLNLSKRFVTPTLENTTNGIKNDIKLYKCSDVDGKYRVVEYRSGPLMQSYLNSDDVFIIDNGFNGIWVWVGKNANDKERSEAMRNARGFVKKKKYPSTTPVTRVIDRNEPIEFKVLFNSWKNKCDEKINKGYASLKPSQMAVTKFDAQIMIQRPSLAAEKQLIDDGTGTLRIWRIDGKDLIEISTKRHEYFMTEYCYIITYTYKSTKEFSSAIYCWMGKKSNTDEQQIAMDTILAKSFDQCETAMQVFVTEGHEPPHFMQLFKGKMVIFMNKESDAEGINHNKSQTYLLRVSGSTTYNTKATQVPFCATSLDSNYCFVLQNNAMNFVWCGSYTTGDGREMAKNFAGIDFDLVLEGSEKSEFWDAIKGKKNYKTTKENVSDSDFLPARLFHPIIFDNCFKVEEVFNFSQNDLIPENIMLLDAHHTVYTWIGQLTPNYSSRVAHNLALQYLQSDPSGRDLQTVIIQVKQNHEPPIFTGFFNYWNSNLWQLHKPYEALRQELQSTHYTEMKTRPSIREDCEFDKYHKYPISILTGDKEQLPTNINPLRKELYLTHDDFVSLFKIDYTEFESMPQWKQQNMKKKVGLF